jgi:hypothetical protein
MSRDDVTAKQMDRGQNAADEIDTHAIARQEFVRKNPTDPQAIIIQLSYLVSPGSQCRMHYMQTGQQVEFWRSKEKLVNEQPQFRGDLQCTVVRGIVNNEDGRWEIVLDDSLKPVIRQRHS